MPGAYSYCGAGRTGHLELQLPNVRTNSLLVSFIDDDASSLSSPSFPTRPDRWSKADSDNTALPRRHDGLARGDAQPCRVAAHRTRPRTPRLPLTARALPPPLRAVATTVVVSAAE